MTAADPTEKTSRPWLSSTLVVLTLVSLTQDAASELLYPLLPVFLTGVLAAPPVVLGVVEGLADATAGVIKFFAGRWSDRFGRKRFIAAGYGLAAVGKAAVAGAVGWPMVLAGRVGDRFGKGLRSAPRDALIASSVPRQALGRAFGFHRAGDSLGAVIGPLLGLLALTVVDGDIRAAMWWAVVPAVVSVLLTALVRDGESAAVAARQPAEVGSGPWPAAFRRVVGVLTLVSLANFSDALLLLRVVELGFGTTRVVAAYVAFNVVNTLSSYPAGLLADRWPKRVVYGLGLAMFAVGYVGLGVVRGGAPVFLLIGTYGMFPAFTDGVGKAWVASLVEPHRLGRAQGAYQALNNGAVLVAGIWAGLAWNVGSGDGSVPLLVSGTLGAVAALVLLSPGSARWLGPHR